eukprot:6213098-Pleurochrysis_carterae.AAC.4
MAAAPAAYILARLAGSGGLPVNGSRRRLPGKRCNAPPRLDSHAWPHRAIVTDGCARTCPHHQQSSRETNHSIDSTMDLALQALKNRFERTALSDVGDVIDEDRRKTCNLMATSAPSSQRVIQSTWRAVTSIQHASVAAFARNDVVHTVFNPVHQQHRQLIDTASRSSEILHLEKTCLHIRIVNPARLSMMRANSSTACPVDCWFTRTLAGQAPSATVDRQAAASRAKMCAAGAAGSAEVASVLVVFMENSLLYNCQLLSTHIYHSDLATPLRLYFIVGAVGCNPKKEGNEKVSRPGT